MRTRLLLLGLVLVVAACGDGDAGMTTTTVATSNAGSTSSPPSTTQATSATAASSTTTTTTTAPAGLQLGAETFVIHGLGGLVTASGELLYPTDPLAGSENLVRDHAGGLVFSDAFGLWWWRAAALDPELVLEGGPFELVEAIPTNTGPVVRIAGNPDRYIDLTTLTAVEPITGAVTVGEDFDRSWTAANGLTVRVTEPEVSFDFEGFPDQVIEPAHLVVTQRDTVLLDIRVGGPAEAYARIHDFDGRTVILSRGPFEPALPPETFMVVDLGCPECTTEFIAASATAALTGPDGDWAGEIAAPALACSAWDPEYAGAAAAGLTDAAEITRSATLRAAAACDVTGVQYELSFEAEFDLASATVNRFEPSTWLEAAPNLLGEIDTALRLPGRLVDDEAAEYVFPAWYAVSAWEELSSGEQAAMEEWYGPEAPAFWADYASIARPDDLRIGIGIAGTITAIVRPAP